MKKTLVAMLMACALLTACASSDKSGDASVDASRLNEWDTADITNLDETQYSERFKREVQPVIYFEFNSVALTPQAMDVLNTQAAWLKENANAMIVVEGHCDERGTREYNLALGERRANAVKEYFALKGIDTNRIRMISYGKERPQVLGAGEAAWSQNRRAVTIAN